MFGFEKLRAYTLWEEIALTTYSLIKQFPKEEIFALCGQMRRAAVSIPSNIAEGLSRYSRKDQAHFIEIAYGSLMELYCQFRISLSLQYIHTTEFDKIIILIEEEAKILSGLRKVLTENKEE